MSPRWFVYPKCKSHWLYLLPDLDEKINIMSIFIINVSTCQKNADESIHPTTLNNAGTLREYRDHVIYHDETINER
jgi:hypothetical protein